MAGLLATLGGNPFNTPVGQKIEQATDASLPVENWALNMEICDMINDTDEGPKDCIRAIRKRLQQNMGKNYTVVLYTLTVLETCVKNCNRRFHLLITQKDFVLDLVKLIGPKNDPPLAIQDRVLSLIQSWADAFHGNPEMHGVVSVYQDLKQKGIEFPMTDLDTMAPIITPHRTAAPPAAAIVQPELATEPKHIPPPPPPQASPMPENVVRPPKSSSGLKQEQLIKLNSELDIVQGNMRVFGEMLTEMSPGQEHPEDLHLLVELHKTLSAMQSRIVELIGGIGMEEITNELLRINDELNNLFLRYERYEKKQRAVEVAAEVKPPLEPPAVPPREAVIPEKPLIDFGDSNEINDIDSQLQQLSVGEGEKVERSSKVAAVAPSLSADIADEFDMFAQSRNVSYEASKAKGSSYADNTHLDNLQAGLGYYAQNKGQVPVDEDMHALSRWLNDKPDAEANAGHPVSSTEFEKFLQKRGTAAEMLPDVPATRPTSNQPPTPANRRQLEKEDAESALFTL